MRYNEIPRAGLKVSVVSLGTWVFGGEHWGGSEEKLCADVVSRALGAGINMIDTAPVYGWGRAEEIVGQALKGRRDKVILATKCGLVQAGGKILINLKPESVKQELETSLKRLNTDYIDIYQTHWPDGGTPLEATLETLSKFAAEGKIRHIGLCNVSLSYLQNAARLANIATVQNEYSLLKRSEGESVFSFCREAGIGFLAYGCLGGGVLTGKYKAEPDFAKGDARSFFYKFYKGAGFSKAAKTAEALKAAAKPHSATAAQAALNWALANPAVSAVLAGARKPEQIADAAACADWRLTGPELAALTALS